jgi:tetracycline resistance efflux pump
MVMEGSWVSIIPFLVVIPIAIITRQVLPGLTLGLIVGAYLIEPTPIGGMKQSLAYVVESLSDENNLKIIIFLYLFSGLIGMVKISGGIKGFVHNVSKRIHSKKGAFLLTWISTIGTFSAPSFRIVTIAPVMKALLKKVKMTKQELAFVIETTTQPIIVLIPIATAFVGYMVSVVEMGLHNEGIQADAYTMYLKSIPFNFFAISMIFVGTYFSFFHHSKKPQDDGEAGKPEEVNDEDWEDCHPAVAKDLPSRPWNLIIPLFLVIGLTLFLTWWDGFQKGFGFFQAFIQADVLEAMVVALIITFLTTMVMLLFQKIKLSVLIREFVQGGNELMSVILLLAVVWGLSGATQDLGFSEFVTTNVGWIPSMFVPPVLFLIGALVSYFIGSSWGTWGILMPLGISLAAVSGASLPLVIGAVFASGSFGSFASPLSDSVNTLGKILEIKVVQYSRFKLIPALIAAGIATILFGAATFIL